ncbi:hypothetical protein [Glycomyces harbinensis]|uniref:JAB domain-containing protein n=1 Tax=Glycomyces harbinensis TaxID=58114 RepID=A0A1G6XA16_9ACTN|nr:hypothetical protein [Glycomyces harbinensis]SDD74882.1 hypothetical protein SAMN05216270_10751 [Glycomyces harbinensis]
MEQQRALIRIYGSEIDCIADETADHPEIETGGSLFGLWSDRGNPTIHLATRPGPNAERHVTLFAQDPEFHWQIEQLVLHHFGVQAVGLWHSHHRLGLPELSGGDLRRTREFSRRTERVKFTDILTYFDTRRPPEQEQEVCLKPHVYADASAGRQLPARFEVIPGVSPLRAALHRIVPRAYRSALDRAPRRPRASTRLERSLLLEDRYEDDLMPTPQSVVRREAPQDRSSSEAPATGSRPALSEAPAIGPAPETSEPEAPQEQSGPWYGVPDLDRFLVGLEALLARAGVPSSVVCTIEPTADSGPVLLNMEAANGSLVHDLDLAVVDGNLMAIRHRVRDPRFRDATELITEVCRAEDALRRAVQSFRKLGSV